MLPFPFRIRKQRNPHLNLLTSSTWNTSRQRTMEAYRNLYQPLVMISTWNFSERNRWFTGVCANQKRFNQHLHFWKRNFLSFTSHFVASTFNKTLIHVITDLYLTFMIYWSCSKYVNFEYNLTASLNSCSCMYSCRDFRFYLKIYRLLLHLFIKQFHAASKL